MKLARHPRDLVDVSGPIGLAAGFFDGLHCGHQAVLQATRNWALASGGSPWVMTFDIHPAKIIQPADAPPLITSTRHKLALLERTGMAGCLLLPFNRIRAQQEPEAFLDWLFSQAPGIRAIFTGENWRFGRQGRGDLSLLRDFAKPRQILVKTIRPKIIGGAPISSTRIRAAVRDGDLTLAAHLLGRPFSLMATVGGGLKIGRKLGFPTANLTPDNEVRPPFGVYAVHAMAEGCPFEGVLNYGRRPTLGTPSSPLMELHLLDTRLHLYRRTIEVFWGPRLRDERTFPSLMALARQIADDIKMARLALRQPSEKKLWKKTLQDLGIRL
jgi:riboflavin kinase/FMN adenylyltransferase